MTNPYAMAGGSDGCSTCSTGEGLLSTSSLLTSACMTGRQSNCSYCNGQAVSSSDLAVRPRETYCGNGSCVYPESRTGVTVTVQNDYEAEGDPYPGTFGEIVPMPVYSPPTPMDLSINGIQALVYSEGNRVYSTYSARGTTTVSIQLPSNVRPEGYVDCYPIVFSSGCSWGWGIDFTNQAKLSDFHYSMSNAFGDPVVAKNIGCVSCWSARRRDVRVDPSGLVSFSFSMSIDVRVDPALSALEPGNYLFPGFSAGISFPWDHSTKIFYPLCPP